MKIIRDGEQIELSVQEYLELQQKGKVVKNVSPPSTKKEIRDSTKPLTDFGLKNPVRRRIITHRTLKVSEKDLINAVGVINEKGELATPERLFKAIGKEYKDIDSFTSRISAFIARGAPIRRFKHGHYCLPKYYKQFMEQEANAKKSAGVKHEKPMRNSGHKYNMFMSERMKMYHKQGMNTEAVFKASVNDWNKQKGAIKLATSGEEAIEVKPVQSNINILQQIAMRLKDSGIAVNEGAVDMMLSELMRSKKLGLLNVNILLTSREYLETFIPLVLKYSREIVKHYSQTNPALGLGERSTILTEDQVLKVR